MKRFKHIFALLLVVALLASALSISASAAYYNTDTSTGQGSSRFDKAWKKTKHIKLAIPRLAK